jgi:hypothetical protein
MPDYNKMETVNRISVRGGVWNADRTGFVRIGYIPVAGNWFDVNIFNPDGTGGTTVHRTCNIAQGTTEGVRTVLPVGKGMRIQITGQNAGGMTDISCYFIPPKFTAIPQSRITVEPGGDYHPDEQPVLINDNGVIRPKQWIEGRPVYRMAFGSMTVGNVDSLAPDETKKIALSSFVPNLREITDEFLTVNIANIQDRMRLGSNSTASNAITTVIATALVTAKGGAMYFKNTRTSAFSASGNDIYLFGWVEYTKTTD